MIEQYPHTLSYATQGTPDVWDDELGWIPGVPGVTASLDCRATPSGAGKRVKNQDGIMVDYNYDLAFPVDTDPIPVGTLVTVTGLDGQKLVSEPLLGWMSGQLHCRGWV